MSHASFSTIPPADVGLSPPQRGALMQLGGASVAAAVKVLSMLVRRPVHLGSPELAFIAWGADDGGAGEPSVVVQVEYVSGVRGHNWLVLEAQGARAIAASMMGEVPGDRVPLDDLHLSALAEAMNQMMGASATALSNLLERPVAISPPTVQLRTVQVAPVSSPKSTAEVVLAFPLRLPDASERPLESRVLQIFPGDLARRLADEYLARTATSQTRDPEALPEATPLPGEAMPGPVPQGSAEEATRLDPEPGGSHLRKR